MILSESEHEVTLLSGVMARFSGRCDSCNTRIIASVETIVNVDGQWLHEDCALVCDFCHGWGHEYDEEGAKIDCSGCGGTGVLAP